MQPVAARAIDRELAEGDEEQRERRGGEGLVALGLEADEKINEIHRRQNGEREQKAQQEFAARAEIFQRVAAENSYGTKDVGGCSSPARSDRSRR